MKPTPTLESLLRQIVRLQRLDRGTLSVLRQGPHGPYYNHQCYEGGKNVTRYVPAAQVAPLKHDLEAYRLFQALVEQYVELLVQQTRAERATGSKESNTRPPTPPRTSSWRGMRKSSG
jgi:hypothetical protein